MPEMSGTPARFARWTKALSKETNLAPGGLLLKCIASASSIPDAVSVNAAASDDSSSTCTFLRPSSFVNAVRPAFTKLLGLKNVQVEDESSLAAALTLTASGIELADAMHLSSRPPGAKFVSFDKAFVQRAIRAGVPDISGMPVRG